MNILNYFLPVTSFSSPRGSSLHVIPNELDQNTHVCVKFFAALALGILNFVGIPVYFSLAAWQSLRLPKLN